MTTPVVKGASFVITHTPSLVRYGSKPTREINKNKENIEHIQKGLRSFHDAVAYLPNQVFIGNERPDSLKTYERPWTNTHLSNANRFSQSGEITPEVEFYGWLKIADEFQLISLDENFLTNDVKPMLAQHPLIKESDLASLGDGVAHSQIKEKLENSSALPLYVQEDGTEKLIGLVEDGHDEDHVLSAHTMLENLSNKASGIIAMRHALQSFKVCPEDVGYVLGCDEEAVGDRYQRGGGNMAKAIASHTDCTNASGSDIKSFCCAPAHAVAIASSFVKSGFSKEVLIVGGGSLAKLGMKFAGNLAKDMPIIEDQMGAIAILVGQDDGESPKIRTDAFGKHDISAGSSTQAIYQALVSQPLQQLNKKITDIDKYAVEMHNPDVTEPNGNGNVPKGNYRIIGAMAALKGEIDKKDVPFFEDKYGMLGFSPTQGHIASAIPFLGHARDMIMNGEINNAMFIGKGSLFLGKMTTLSDGMSFLIEKNEGGHDDDGS
ncbi:glycine/sarcosine/betaine reductase complex component C subunit beta [Texcoconibacillus texcoconensis]|uniref:Betaine reductase n=1 Tax=Texcoconibacillus texcoconensis TaxID=1095777 RepID=A0A840QQW3_9BACI|nr:glycine/sarcosine/betaine reductase complex component C subunit beta [Texcoconibacillus texcoconensis]MBB5173739.1 betaine reductase [Texcoconibacillus texcoconensis]